LTAPYARAGATASHVLRVTTNPGLHDYYRSLGFQHVRTVSSRISGACFQRPAQPYIGPLKTEE
jgi:hypothetical protein